MKKAIILIGVLILTACGGPAVNQNASVYYTGNNDSYIKQLEQKGAYVITREELPGLYDLISQSNWSVLLPLLGNSGGIMYGTLTTGNVKIHYMQPSDTPGEYSASVMDALLHYAMMKGDLDMARKFIDKGADPNGSDRYRDPLLFEVLDKNKDISKRLEFVALFLEAGANPNIQSRRGFTLLSTVMLADIEDKTLIMGKLLNARANPNAKDKRGNTALHNVLGRYSKLSGRLELGRLLLEAGANPNIKNNNGDTPMHVALDKYNEMPDKLEMAFLLLEAGADPNAKNSNGDTAMHFALDKRNEMSGKLDLALRLLDAGADPNAKNSDGNTWLLALFDRLNHMPDKQKLALRLLDAGADPNARNARGLTVLKAAIYSEIKDKKTVISKLIERGADPALKDSSGQAALHVAVRFIAEGGAGPDEDAALEWLELLVQKSTDLDARNKLGKTPLAFAFFGGKKKVEQYLLDRGATDYGIKHDPGTYTSLDNMSMLGLTSLEVFELDREHCEFILHEYDVDFESLSGITGVDIPIRLNSPVGGITYRHTGGNKKFSIMDCRLAVTLLGWAPVLHKNKVVEVEHMRAYSPGARVGGGKKISGHNYALAIDAAHFILKDGKRLVMKEDWSDRRRGADPCAPPETGDSSFQKAIRKIACDTAGVDLFNVILTPHYNKAHYDHLHMEIVTDQDSFVR